ncbi:MAG: GGDEF domain-containing protein [Sedimentibacter sp.]
MVNLGEIENKLGKVYFVNENYIKAEEYFFCALNRLEKVNNKFYTIDVLVNIAKLQIENNSKDSFYYYGKAIQYAEEINAKKKLSEVCKTVSEYYEKIGNFRDALEYSKKHCRVNEEIMTSNLGNKLEILKIELGHFKEKNKFGKIKIINQRLEMEILNQRNELEKIKKSNEILEKKAFEDELTGIPNRRCIKFYLNNIWEKSLLDGDIIILFIIDIDNFKKYNDYWGHSKGDECLVKVANCMKNIQVKRKDFLGRYGGEEFIYCSKGINYDQALELGNLIRHEVEKIGLNYMIDDKKNMVTISLGGALGKASDFNSISNMVKIADKELYRAKGMGRNITLLNGNRAVSNS